MKTGLVLTLAGSLAASPASAWTTSSTSSSSSRRAFLDQAAKIVPLVLIAEPGFAEDEVAAPPPPAASSEAAAPALAGDAPIVVTTDASAAEATITPALIEETAPAAIEPPAPLDDNEFIATLKARSIANKDKNKALAERPDKLSFAHFKDNYARPSFVGIYHTEDPNDVTMVLKEDFDQMMVDGKIKTTYHSKISKKTGEISDDYSRPIYMYAN